jgi:hypothetical protein
MSKSKSKQTTRKSNKKNNKNGMQMVSYKAPVATTMLFKPRNPNIHNSGKGTILSHTELIGDFTALTTAYESTKYEVNPGIAATFPWLAGFAVNFESYRFRKLIFHYHTSAPTTESGTIYLAPDYDASDAAYPSEAAISNTGGSVSIAVWKNTILRLSPKLIHQQNDWLYVRSQYVGTAIADYDGCSVSIASIVNTPGAKGKLIVEYEVEFRTPNTSIDEASQVVPMDQFYSASPSTSGASDISANATYYLNWAQNKFNGIPDAVVYNDAQNYHQLKVPATVHLSGGLSPELITAGTGTSSLEVRLQSSPDDGKTWYPEQVDVAIKDNTALGYANHVGWNILKHFDAGTLLRSIVILSGMGGAAKYRLHHLRSIVEAVPSKRVLDV